MTKKIEMKWTQDINVWCCEKSIRRHTAFLFRSWGSHGNMFRLLILIGLIQINWTDVYGQKNETDMKADMLLHLPEEKKTAPGLYATSVEAYEAWQSSHGGVKIIDVRTVDEYLYVGHPTMAWNIPFLLQTYDWDSEKGHFKMRLNPDFLQDVQAVAGPGDTLYVTCRSGGRAALAINALAKAGYTNVYNIIDGIEGDPVEDPESVFYGQRMKNGWKNAGLPWTYHPDPEKMRLPAH